jgi:hypothetical protein
MNARDDESNTGAATTADTGHQFQLGIRLQPVEQSDQPVFANFSFVQGAQGMLFLDFGFLEPSVMPSVLRLARGGGKLPETVSGKLAARVVLGLDAATQLAQQLEHHLRGMKAQAARPAASGQVASH